MGIKDKDKETELPQRTLSANPERKYPCSIIEY